MPLALERHLLDIQPGQRIPDLKICRHAHSIPAPERTPVAGHLGLTTDFKQELKNNAPSIVISDTMNMISIRTVSRTFLQTATLVLVFIFAVGQVTATAAPAETVQPVAWDDFTGAALQSWECDAGNVCFWPEFGGVGARCMWSVDDPNWTSGSITCSWAAVLNAKSVWNNRAKAAAQPYVHYYKKSGYNDRIGCTKPEQGGNLAGTYQIRSHLFSSSACNS